MLKENKIEVKKNMYKKEIKYVKDDILNLSAKKKEEILNVISEGQQLTLLGLLVSQIGDKIGLDTPEFVQAKAVFAQIQDILASK